MDFTKEKHLGHRIFVCDGRIALRYFPQQNIWYKVADMMFDHETHCLVQCKDKLYIFDGQRVEYGQLRLTEHYMPSISSYGTLQRSGYRESFCSLSPLNGDVYAVHNNCFRGRISIQRPERND